MIIGSIIGFVVGFILAFILLRAMVIDADAKYKKATTRWEAGTAEYKKVVQGLEVQRTEKAASKVVIVGVLDAVINLLTENDPQHKDIPVFRELKAQLGA